MQERFKMVVVTAHHVPLVKALKTHLPRKSLNKKEFMNRGNWPLIKS